MVYIIMGWLLQGCGTPRKIFVNEEFESNNRSSSIDLRFLKDDKTRLLGYRILRDSVISASSSVKEVNMGIIIPQTKVTEVNMENESAFGNDSLQCLIRYHVFYKFVETKPSVLLSRSLSKAEREPKQSITDVKITGFLQYSGFESKIVFTYTDHTGFVLPGSDSLKLIPIYQGNWKPMQTLIGVQLVKGDIVYGVVHSFTGISRKKAYLYTKATPAEQLLIAANFAVIARYL
jgi:hypothetical protein